MDMSITAIARIKADSQRCPAADIAARQSDISHFSRSSLSINGSLLPALRSHLSSMSATLMTNCVISADVIQYPRNG